LCIFLLGSEFALKNLLSSSLSPDKLRFVFLVLLVIAPNNRYNIESDDPPHRWVKQGRVRVHGSDDDLSVSFYFGWCTEIVFVVISHNIKESTLSSGQTSVAKHILATHFYWSLLRNWTPTGKEYTHHGLCSKSFTTCPRQLAGYHVEHIVQ
jgi:hypothetical protein